ncbi:MAG: prepilin-type N-terminal cleavage/methylation domain-containing protein [Planctomycetes bacterium]|nr:prepilin-type N-terminal cleavage/methylation domain-containing protein [Planctomycetota bacterium]
MKRFYSASAMRPRGFTLLEMMVCLSVLTLVVMVTITVISTTNDHMKFELIVSDQQTRTRAALDKMMQEMRSMSNEHTLDATSDESFSFQQPVFNLTTKTVTYGSAATLITYRRIASDKTANPPTGNEIQGNGVDDDGNGLIDSNDNVIERIVGDATDPANGNREIILVNVPSNGFLVKKDGRRLQIRVTRQDVTPMQTNDERRIATVVTYNTYALRNE